MTKPPPKRVSAKRPPPKPAVVAPPKRSPARTKAPKRRELTPEALAQAIDLPTAAGGGYLPIDTLLKYQAFVAHYLATGNATDAARKAGFTAPTDPALTQLSLRLLAHPDVIPILSEQYRSLVLRHQATPDRIWAELARAAFLDPASLFNEAGDVKNVADMDEDTRRAIAKSKTKVSTFGEDGESTEREVTFVDKMAALGMLTKLHGMIKSDQLVLVNSDDFLRSIEEGRARRERATKR